MSCAKEASKVWMGETMGWGAWLFDSAVRAESESIGWVGCFLGIQPFLFSCSALAIPASAALSRIVSLEKSDRQLLPMKNRLATCL